MSESSVEMILSDCGLDVGFADIVVCVREDDGGDLARAERERLAIERFERPGSLEQAAIDQDRAAVMFKLHARACDCPRGAVEGVPGLVIRHCTCSKLAGS